MYICNVLSKTDWLPMCPQEAHDTSHGDHDSETGSADSYTDSGRGNSEEGDNCRHVDPFSSECRGKLEGHGGYVFIPFCWCFSIFQNKEGYVGNYGTTNKCITHAYAAVCSKGSGDVTLQCLWFTPHSSASFLHQVIYHCADFLWTKSLK